MGRLVNPISKEEYERLPKWQKWCHKHPIIIIGLTIIFMFVIIAIGHLIG